MTRPFHGRRPARTFRGRPRHLPAPLGRALFLLECVLAWALKDPRKP